MKRRTTSGTAAERAAALAAAGEVALALGCAARAEELAARALALDGACGRAAVLLETARCHRPPPAKRADDARVPLRVAAAFQREVQPSVRIEEAREIVLALMSRGRSRARLPRRLGRGRLPTGTRAIVHHTRPGVSVLVREGRAVALRVRRTEPSS